MSVQFRTAVGIVIFCFSTGACVENKSATTDSTAAGDSTAAQSIADRIAKYTTVALVADTTPLTAKERQMIPLLIDAARLMDPIYWMQTYGNRDSLIAAVSDADTKKFIDWNYGPWDRLDNNTPFVPGVGPRPPGGNLYPRDLRKAEFDSAVAKGPAAHADSLKSQYTLVRRAAGGGLDAVPYKVAFKTQNDSAAAKLLAAAALAEDGGLRRYLTLRAAALTSDDYQASDLAWMDMKNNTLDIVIGPIENYEDELLRLQDGERSVRSDQGQDVEPAPREIRRDAAGASERIAGCRRVQERDTGNRLRSQRVRRDLLRGRSQRRARRRSPSIFRTTSRCSSRRARADSSSRT